MDRRAGNVIYPGVEGLPAQSSRTAFWGREKHHLNKAEVSVYSCHGMDRFCKVLGPSALAAGCKSVRAVWAQIVPFDVGEWSQLSDNLFFFSGFTIPCQLDAEGHPCPSTRDPPSGNCSADKHRSAQCQPAWLSSLCFSWSHPCPFSPPHFASPFFLWPFIISFLTSLPLLLWALSLYLLAFCRCFFSYNNCAVHRKSKKGNQDSTFAHWYPLLCSVLLLPRSLWWKSFICVGCMLQDSGSHSFWAVHNRRRLRFCLWPLGATVIQIRSLRNRHVLIHAVYGTGLL